VLVIKRKVIYLRLDQAILDVVVRKGIFLGEAGLEIKQRQNKRSKEPAPPG